MLEKSCRSNFELTLRPGIISKRSRPLKGSYHVYISTLQQRAQSEPLAYQMPVRAAISSNSPVNSLVMFWVSRGVALQEYCPTKSTENSKQCEVCSLQFALKNMLNTLITALQYIIDSNIFLDLHSEEDNTIILLVFISNSWNLVRNPVQLVNSRIGPFASQVLNLNQ